MNSQKTISFPTPRIAAVAIASAALLVMVALFHHPVISHHGDVRDMQLQIVRISSADNLVHGALTALLAVFACTLAIFCKTFGVRRPAVSMALAAYCLGCLLLGVAMLFDGFAVPRIAAQFLSAHAFEAERGMLIIRSTGVVIQLFSKAGLIAHCAAILAWSYAAATGGQTSARQRWLAGIGVPAALLPAAFIMFTDLQLAPHNLMMIFAAHGVWYLAAARVLYGSGANSNSACVLPKTG